MGQVGVENIRAVAIANQRETALMWERESLKPVGPAIVWQCRRTANAAAELNTLHGDQFRSRSGLRPDAYFSGPKFSWLLDHSPTGGERQRSSCIGRTGLWNSRYLAAREANRQGRSTQLTSPMPPGPCSGTWAVSVGTTNSAPGSAYRCRCCLWFNRAAASLD